MTYLIQCDSEEFIVVPTEDGEDVYPIDVYSDLSGVPVAHLRVLCTENVVATSNFVDTSYEDECPDFEEVLDC